MARTTIRTEDITASEVTTAKMATDPTNASNLASGTVGSARMGSGTASSTTVLYGDGSWKAEPTADTSGLEDDIALLGFKVASNGSLAKYNLVDQTVDDFQSAAGIDASASTDESYDASGKFFVSSSSDVEYIAKGGGRGGPRSSGTGMDGGDGGSGAGGGTDSGAGHTSDGGASNKNTYSGWTSQGGTGGTGRHLSGAYEGGGGGGSPNTSSPNGSNNVSGTGGAGADGYATDISGSSVTYAGGGGAGGNSNGSGGTGYGDTANRGGGGQGMASGWGSNGQNGGSGVVWLDYTPDGGSATQTGITSTGTWTVPVGVTATDVMVLGGGGAGGNGNSAGGGGGGGMLRHETFAVTPGDIWTITIGLGGVSTGASTGGDTTFAVPVYDAAMTLISTSTTAESAPTKGDIVFTYTNGTGTATIGTDLTAEYSCDGSTWTDFGISSGDVQGTTGGHTIVTKHDVALTSTSGTSMTYRIKTLNQSASKQTYIHAVSLGWS